MKANKKIFILFTRFPDNGSKVIEAMTGSFYSHTSIGLEEDMNTFYSFVVKGFIVEKITRYIKPDRAPMPCQLYEIEVTEQVYERVKVFLSEFVKEQKEKFYSKIGLVFCLLRIPFKQKNGYFCTQFVAEVLKRTEAAKVEKYTVLCLPKDLQSLAEMKLVFEGNLQSFIAHFGIQKQTYLA